MYFTLLLFLFSGVTAGKPGSKNCTVRWFRQPLDHFAFNNAPAGSDGYWSQRYLVFDKYFDPTNGTVFFYTYANPPYAPKTPSRTPYLTLTP